MPLADYEIIRLPSETCCDHRKRVGASLAEAAAHDSRFDNAMESVQVGDSHESARADMESGLQRVALEKQLARLLDDCLVAGCFV